MPALKSKRCSSTATIIIRRPADSTAAGCCPAAARRTRSVKPSPPSTCRQRAVGEEYPLQCAPLLGEPSLAWISLMLSSSSAQDTAGRKYGQERMLWRQGRATATAH